MNIHLIKFEFSDKAHLIGDSSASVANASIAHLANALNFTRTVSTTSRADSLAGLESTYRQIRPSVGGCQHAPSLSKNHRSKVNSMMKNLLPCPRFGQCNDRLTMAIKNSDVIALPSPLFTFNKTKNRTGTVLLTH